MNNAPGLDTWRLQYLDALTHEVNLSNPRQKGP